jgi:hypothetical protein
MIALTRAMVTSLAAIACITSACAPAEQGGNQDSLADTAAAADAEMLLRTNATEYQVDTTGGEIAVSIAVSVANETTDSLFLSTCGANTPSYLMERLADGEYTVALRPVCPMIATPPLVIAPGASRTDTLMMRAALPREGEAAVSAPNFEADGVEGSYRIIYEVFERGWDVGGTPDPATRLTLDARSSNRFTLRP